MVIAIGTGARVIALSVEAPVELLPGLETTTEKLERFVRPLREEGIDASTELRTGKPSRESLESLGGMDDVIEDLYG